MSNLITCKRKIRELESRISILESDQVIIEGGLEDVVEDVSTITSDLGTLSGDVSTISGNVDDITTALEDAAIFDISAYDIVTETVGTGDVTSGDVLVTIDRQLNQEVITLTANDVDGISTGITFANSTLESDEIQTIMNLGTLSGSAGAHNIIITGTTPLGVIVTNTFVINL